MNNELLRQFRKEIDIKEGENWEDVENKYIEWLEKKSLIFLQFSNLKEKLAEFAHNQRSGWMKYLFSKCYEVRLKTTLTDPYGEVNLVIPKQEIDKLKRQMNTEYNDLSEKEKNSDRKEADDIIKIFYELL